MKNETRKAPRWLALLLALVMVFSLAACSDSSSSSSSSTSNDTASTADNSSASDAADSASDASASDDSASSSSSSTDDPYKDPYADPYTNNSSTDDPYSDPYSSNSDPYADPYSNNTGDDTAASVDLALTNDEYIPEDGEKYTVTETADGWLKIENEDGETLGLSKISGVKLVEDDGYAFKDLNGNGELDPYEDWRLSSDERAKNLVELMDGEEMARILAHGGWGDFTTDPLTATDGSYTYLTAGGRGGVTRQISRGGGVHAKWTNLIQEAAESCFYGIPAMISIDPANISGLIECVALGSTMDPELAADIGKTTAQQYRSAGVTALLGPQVDISSPIMGRAGGTYGEDPQLTLDIATAYVNAMQSTYGESGEDLGWGDESVYCFTKHFAGAGSTEGGRDDHTFGGRYAVFPGNNLAAHLITYFDGVFSLPGKTGASGIMTEYAIDVDGDGVALGNEEYAGAYNRYLYGMLDAYGYDSLIITDWGVFGDFGPTSSGNWTTGVWGTEDMEQPERIALCWERGGNLLGGYSNTDNMAEAYQIMVDDIGEDEALATIQHAAYNYIVTMMNLNMFDQPYNDSAYADEICYSKDSNAYGLETQEKSVVMIKNDGVIKEGGNGNDKPTVYIPYTYNDGFVANWMSGIKEGEGSWNPGLDLDVMEKYFKVVTDSTRKGEVTRASEEDIAKCDYILVGMTGAYGASYGSHLVSAWGGEDVAEGDEVYYPASLQYGEYTADTARDPSISGVMLEDGTRENRSYKGQTARKDANYGALEALEYAASVAGDIPVIASVSMERGMVWSEVEPLCDAILVCYNSQKPEAVANIVLGNVEPSGLLVFQQPASMEDVEAQVDDVPRDIANLYVDAAGNTYDFAFGMNWSGVIADARVAKYSAAPLTAPTKFDVAAYTSSYSADDGAAADTAADADTADAG